MYWTDRRQFFSVCGSVLGSVTLAGCTENNGSSNGDRNDSGESDTSQVNPSATIANSELFHAPFFQDGTGDDVPWLRIEVENPTDELHRDIEIQSRFRDSEDNIVSTREQYTAALPPQTTWVRYTRHDFNLSNITKTENEITSQYAGTRGQYTNELEILNSSLDFDGNVVSISGEIEAADSNTSDLVIVPLIYDDDDRYRGAFRIQVQNVGSTIAFDDGLVGFRAPYSEPEPAEFELRIAEPYF